MGLLEEQVARNIANRIAIEKSMGKDINDESCLDMLEKAGRAAAMGEVRTWNGKEYVKTPKGWRPKPKGYKEGGEKKVPSSVKIEQKTFHVKDGKIRASMYDKQSRISKLMKFAKENGLKVEWEESQEKEQGESLVDMINRKLKEGHAAVKDSMKDDAKKIAEGDKEAKRSELARQLEELDEKLFEHEKRRGDYDRQADWARDKKEMQDKFDKLQAEHRKLMGRGWGMRS